MEVLRLCAEEDLGSTSCTMLSEFKIKCDDLIAITYYSIHGYVAHMPLCRSCCQTVRELTICVKLTVGMCLDFSLI